MEPNCILPSSPLASIWVWIHQLPHPSHMFLTRPRQRTTGANHGMTSQTGTVSSLGKSLSPGWIWCDRDHDFIIEQNRVWSEQSRAEQSRAQQSTAQQRTAEHSRAQQSSGEQGGVFDGRFVVIIKANATSAKQIDAKSAKNAKNAKTVIRRVRANHVLAPLTRGHSATKTAADSNGGNSKEKEKKKKTKTVSSRC